jgi:hypothetical protein
LFRPDQAARRALQARLSGTTTGSSALRTLAVPVALIGCVAGAHALLDRRYHPLCDLLLVALSIAAIAALIRGRRLQMVAIAVYSLLCGLAAVEALSLILSTPAPASVTQTPNDLFADHEILGWRPGHPGVVRETRIARQDGTVVYDVAYSIDDNLLRRTVSAADGPTVAFLGDSWVFGEGVDDASAMPQVFADLYEGGLRVLNFGFPGYGPQQFLRAVETGLFDPLLGTQVKLVVFTTFADQIRRAACKSPYMIRAPRYVLDAGGEVEFAGPCARGAERALLEFATNMASYKRYVEPTRARILNEDVELYVATVLRAVALAKARYNARALIVYDRMSDPSYFRWTDGISDSALIARFRSGGAEVLDMDISNWMPAGASATFPNDGHPTATAQHARALALRHHLDGSMPDLAVGR